MQKPDLALYPESPGVYLYKDGGGRILYVGKARRLRRRIASYFRDGQPPKTRALVAHAESIEVLITGTEKEALLLEAGLIKKHRPRYNIVLRDDKEYLLFRIGSEHPYPRLEIIRRERPGRRESRDKGARIFGPFSSGGAARETWRLIHRHFPLRRCRDRVFANRTRPCLYHSMGQCLGPCVLPVPQEEYRALLDKVALLLSGRSRLLAREMKAEMLRASDALQFERAARLRDQIRAVEQTVERQSVVLAAGVDLDVVGIAHVGEGGAAGAVLKGGYAPGCADAGPPPGNSGGTGGEGGVCSGDAGGDLPPEDAGGHGDAGATSFGAGSGHPFPAEGDCGEEYFASFEGRRDASGGLALGVLFVRDGLLLDGRSFFWPGLGVEDAPELIASFLAQFYLDRRELGEAIPPRIVVPWLPAEPGGDEPDGRGEREGETPGNEEAFASGEASGSGKELRGKCADIPDARPALEAILGEYRGAVVRIRAPRGADEDNLMLMAASTAREAAKTSARPALAQMLAARLRLAGPVRRIEVVDISHTGGRQTRAGMVVFQDERPVPDAFRAYSLDEQMAEAGAEAGDDTAALALWAARRARAGAPWPQLVLVDGGKGQLAAVLRAFTEAGVAGEFALASIAKARTEEGRADRRAGNVGDRIFLPGRSNPVALPPGGPELLFLQRARDAAHDFVLGRHRRARAKAVMDAELTRIPGVGPHTARALFERFGSLAAMVRAGETALAETPGVGKGRAKMIYNRLAMLLGKGAEEKP